MRRLTLLLAAVIALVALVASATAAGTTQIAGIQGPNTACGDVNDGTFGMEGSLVGCWYTTAISYYKANPSGTIQVRGTETFIGCLNGPTTCGSFNTTFTFTAKYAPTLAEIHGRCHHPIVDGSGTGVFTGATGLLTFKDDVTNGTAPYKGHITLQ
jgi:hypothetical protein